VINPPITDELDNTPYLKEKDISVDCVSVTVGGIKNGERSGL
jgi:hypothetical protein